MPVSVVVAAIVIAFASQAAHAQGVGPAADTARARLDEFVRAALVNNVDLRAATAAMRETESFGSSVRSRFDPVLSFGADPGAEAYGGQLAGELPTGTRYLFGTVAPSMLPGEPIYPDALVASFSQPLLRGLGSRSSRSVIRGVDEGIAAARARLARTRDEIVEGIVLAYVVLAERHRQEANAERSLRRAEELLTAYTSLRALEKITEVELITAQLGVASRHATVLEHRRDRQDAQDALIFAAYGARAADQLATRDIVLMPVDTAFNETTLPALDDAITRALAARGDVEAARRSVERARFQSQYSRNASLPAFDVSAALSSTRRDSADRARDPGGHRRETEWFVGLELSRPLINSGARADIERASAVEQQAALALVDAENGVRADVRSAFRDIALGREHARLATEAAQLARRQYDGERARLDLGLTDIFRVLQYEEQVALVERAEASAWLSLAAANVRYRTALGGSAESYLR